MCITIPGMPPLEGWAIRLDQEIPEAGYNKGYWMGKWSPDQNGIEFAFEERLHMVFKAEEDARRASDWLRSQTDIDNEIVRVGGH